MKTTFFIHINDLVNNLVSYIKIFAEVTLLFSTFYDIDDSKDQLN